jgi:hypothetical protein
MQIPGFTAEHSLGPGQQGMQGIWAQPAAPNGVSPARVCNPTCLDNCEMDCSDCDDLPTPQSRARCRVYCFRHNLQCLRQCCH